MAWNPHFFQKPSGLKTLLEKHIDKWADAQINAVNPEGTENIVSVIETLLADYLPENYETEILAKLKLLADEVAERGVRTELAQSGMASTKALRDLLLDQNLKKNYFNRVKLNYCQYRIGICVKVGTHFELFGEPPDALTVEGFGLDDQTQNAEIQ